MTAPMGRIRARFLGTSAPTTAEGTERYLASAMIRGIGSGYAKRLPRAFGTEVFDISKQSPERPVVTRGAGKR